MLSQSKYDEIFKSNKKIHKKALKQAYEIRKFEIDLYWKRAAYFWTFIGVAFGGYAAAYSSEIKEKSYTLADKELLLIVISCIGVVFSVAWHYVNKGGKFWQENWENHVELLENEIFGPLYKTITKRPERTDLSWELVSDLFTKPEPFFGIKDKSNSQHIHCPYLDSNTCQIQPTNLLRCMLRRLQKSDSNLINYRDMLNNSPCWKKLPRLTSPDS